MTKDMNSEKIIASILDNKIKSLEEITDIQCQDGNWNYDEYMHGLANGMILSLNVLEDDFDNPYTGQKSKRPLLDAPDKWRYEEL